MGASGDSGPQSCGDSFGELYSLVADEDRLARLAAALWARVGRPLTDEDLGWSCNLTGDDRAPQILWNTLRSTGAFSGSPPKLRAEPLSEMLTRLARSEPSPASRYPNTGEPVWTLPEALREDRFANTYREAAVHLIRESSSRLLIVSPYIEARGVGLLYKDLRRAMSRGVRVALITHAAGDLASINSRALEELRREAVRVGGDLTVFSAGPADSGGDRARQPLLHAKLLCADEDKVLVGSANLTSFGLGFNLEAGVVLGAPAAPQVSAVLYRLLRSGLVYRAYSTRSEG